jgi:hypothetical protein
MSNAGLLSTEEGRRLAREALAAVERCGSIGAAARELGIPDSTLSNRYKRAKQAGALAPKALTDHYAPAPAERTPAEAWAAHASTFERQLGRAARRADNIITRPRGPFVVFHGTDWHLDDNAAPLRLIEADIKAAHDLGAIMCSGGDALNNWPVAGKLAAQWAKQECTLPDAILRLQHFIAIFKPHAWVDGNHEQMNPYLEQIIAGALPPGVIKDFWAVSFTVETPGGRPVRVRMSHKFEKGSSWFHRMHGHLREMLEGEECDLLLDGHVHCDGTLENTIPERQVAALCVASAGYKVLDDYAARISRGGKVPKLRGRCHWVVCDPAAEYEDDLCKPFKNARQAQAYLNGLQNLREM